MSDLPSFSELAAAAEPPLDALALALSAELREVDVAGALATLDVLSEDLGDLVAAAGADPEAQARACADLLGGENGFAGDEYRYDHPVNSMIDVVLARRRRLPILQSVV